MKCYALYKGDEFIALGSAKELAKLEGVRKETITFWATPSYWKRIKNSNNTKLVIRVEDDD